MKSWYNISDEEKDKLEDEFDKKNEYKMYSPYLIFGSLTIAILFIIYGYNIGDIIGEVMMFLGGISFIIGLYTGIVTEYNNQKREKEFVSWLIVEKKIVKEYDCH